MTRLCRTSGSAQSDNDMNSKRRLRPPSLHPASDSTGAEIMAAMPVSVTAQRTRARRNNNNSSLGVGLTETSESKDNTKECAYSAVTYYLAI